MTISIRPITPADAEGYNSALDSVARERRFLRLVEAPSPESSRAFIQRNIERGNPHVVAEADGQIVGWCDICRSDDLGSEHCGWLGMGVLASHRGEGIGRSLLHSALDLARGRFSRVELEVYDTNAAAIALYEACGFAHEGRRRDAFHRDGQVEDIVMMGLLF